jgi:ankyrin repeat protein
LSLAPPQGFAPGSASEGGKGKDGPAEEQQLLKAAKRGDVKAVQTLMLMAQPPPVDARDAKQQTPLMKAAKRGHFKVVKYLLCCYADVDARDYKDRTALMLGASSGCARTVECLL